jgi:glycerophosphoryl diester phosphodiesterase
MIIISHRGNLDGPNAEEENTLRAIKRALEAGFDVEIDVWMMLDELYLGHDEPLEKITLLDIELNREHLWMHAKNHDAFEYLRTIGMRVFWHEEDDFVLTTYGDVWAYPGRCSLRNRIENIIGKPEKIDSSEFRGICTDYPNYYK